MNIAEQPLLHSIQQGDERAFEALYREFYNFLCRFACTLLNDDILAEEVVDDVMIRLWDRRMELKDISLKGYLLRSVRDRKSTRLNSSHANISYAVFCLKKKNTVTPLRHKSQSSPPHPPSHL